MYNFQEMWVCPFTHDDIVKSAEDFDEASPTLAMLSKVAARHGITVIGGSVPEKCDGRLYNTCPIFGPHDNMIAKHRKVSIFIS